MVHAKSVSKSVSKQNGGSPHFDTQIYFQIGLKFFDKSPISIYKAVNMKTKLNYYEYQNRTVCPYCETIINNENSCCGESSAHFETRVVDDATETEMYHPETVEFYRPIRDVIQYEILVYLKNTYLLKSLVRNKVRRLRDALVNVYDGVTWSNGDCQDTLIKRLRIKMGFQWSKLDCLILKQLYDFPLYYTKPKK